MNELALFAGAGGGILGGKLLGWHTVCAVELDAYAAGVLIARQNDGLLAPFPVWDDVRTFDGQPWRGAVDVVTGGFPCQDISVAGKGAGLDGARSGLWSDMARIIGEVRPPFAFVENSPALLVRGFERVLGDLAALGYDCRWTVLGAADVGAPHQRDRLWLLAADTGGERWQQRSGDRETRPVPHDPHGNAPQGQPARHRRFGWAGAAGADVAGAAWQRTAPICESEPTLQDAARIGWEIVPPDHGGTFGAGQTGALGASDRSWWFAEPDVGRVADGVAARMDRLRAIGNGQVPLCAATAWQLLRAGFDTDSAAH